MAGKLTTLLGAAAMALGLGGAAKAATLVIDHGVAGTITTASKNDALVPLFGTGTTSIAGYYGAAIRLVGTAHVTFTLLGAEAGFMNRVLYTGAASGNTLTDPAGGKAFNADGLKGTEGAASMTFRNVAQGLLSFAFWTSGSGKPLTVANGANPNNIAKGVKIPGINFFASFGDTSTRGDSLLLFFDDDGANNDDDHDDLVVQVTIAAVPLPAGGALLLAGLGGLALMRRRRG